MRDRTVQRWKKEFREEGLLLGRQEGRREGMAGFLLRQLDRKFGPVDQLTRDRVQKADPERLLEWGDRFVTAERLEQVFGDCEREGEGPRSEAESRVSF